MCSVGEKLQNLATEQCSEGKNLQSEVCEFSSRNVAWNATLSKGAVFCFQPHDSGLIYGFRHP